jgi:DNA-binding MarR family transcriptional regulator/N-acetylglutamate synthase-like GNAT family acetyltransferase
MPPNRDIASLRAFNMLYTLKLGLLNPRLDDSPFTLTEARVLYELAHRTRPTAADIVRTLDVDPAQLSRTLKRFAERGLLSTSINPEGGRSQLLTLTGAGRKAFAALDRKTHDAMGALLNALPAHKRTRLLSATKEICNVFEERAGTAMSLRDIKTGDLGWITHRQAVLYAEEYGWNSEYEALVAHILAGFTKAFDPSHDAAWIAEVDGRVAGSVFLVRGDEPKVGRLRLLYVEPSARGMGIGAKLVDACIERARAVGDERLQLWTNSVLVAARRIYDRAGFKLTDEAPHHSFGKDLIGQTFELRLKAIDRRGKAA